MIGNSTRTPFIPRYSIRSRIVRRQAIWLLRLSTESPTSSQFNARNRSVRAPNVSTSVVQIGVKSAGWLNRITHLPL